MAIRRLIIVFYLVSDYLRVINVQERTRGIESSVDEVPTEWEDVRERLKL